MPDRGSPNPSTSLKALYDALPGRQEKISPPRIAGSQQMFCLSSYGPDPEFVQVDLTPYGSGAVTFEARGGQSKQKLFSPPEVWSLLPVVDHHWYLLGAKASLAFRKSLAGEERLPSWFVRELREYLNRGDEGEV